jgi:4-amino-4-deoxy-L-arabinose transferase-like glycosyltransferase
MGEGLGGPVLVDVDAPERADPLDRPEHAARGVKATARHARSGAARSPRRSALQFWHSPDDQPSWARPALLAIAVLAALAYAWGMGGDTVETFYGAAVRSMSQSWHNFFFASFDPWGTVSVDKLPGAFWVQALSVRLFGFHTWSLALPQAVEGTLTILVLYRAVRRVAGAGAGLVAAAALAATPVTILLNRGNISDTLLILLLVLAADATTKAITTGRLQPLLLAGLWVGLAFQTKMLQAWLVLPAIFLAYLVAAATPDLVRRVGHVLLCGAITLGVSLSWMLAVSAVPAHDRPYVDASCNDSVFSQVFLYNGADRLSGRTLDQRGCTPATSAAAQGPGGGVANQTVAVPRGPGRFLNGTFGRDGDWLLVPVAVAFVGILVARRRAPRTDALRAGALLWAAWLFFTWSFFADSHFLNSYYLAALAPPIAALCGMGFALAWRLRAQREVRAVLLGTVAAGTAYALYLLPVGAGVRPWVIATTLLGAVVALVVTARSLWLRPGTRSWTTDAGVVLSAAALFAGTAWAAGTVVEAELGPFDSPYQPASTQARAEAAARLAADDASLQRAAAPVPRGVSVLTVATSATASGAILATGREFLPVGGFSGRVPSPTLAAFVADVRAGKVADVLVPVSPRSHNAAMEWVTAHCAAQPDAELGADRDLSGQRMRFYRCSPADASVTAATARGVVTARP